MRWKPNRWVKYYRRRWRRNPWAKHHPVWFFIEGRWKRFRCKCGSGWWTVLERHDLFVLVQCAAGHPSECASGFEIRKPDEEVPETPWWNGPRQATSWKQIEFEFDVKAKKAKA